MTERADGRTASQIRCAAACCRQLHFHCCKGAAAACTTPVLSAPAFFHVLMRCWYHNSHQGQHLLWLHFLRESTLLCHRPCSTLRCERGLLSRADGSAQWSQGGTCCLATVTGPVQCSTSSKEDAERAVVEVVFKPRAGLSGGCLAFPGWRGWLHPLLG